LEAYIPITGVHFTKQSSCAREQEEDKFKNPRQLYAGHFLMAGLYRPLSGIGSMADEVLAGEL
jgi:hypothetical protein